MSHPFDAIETLARCPVLLVACDYDGTLSPLVDDPQRAFPQPEVMVAIKQLAAMPHTHVAIISGRALQDLSFLTGSPPETHLVGSHGSEFEPGFAGKLTADDESRLAAVRSELEQLIKPFDGAHLEFKPASIACHCRRVEESGRAPLTTRVLEAFREQEGLQVREGKMVVEISVVPTDKGDAVITLRRRVGATHVAYFGDDLTDEDAFRVLKDDDFGVKVGGGTTLAAHRLSDPDSVARFLAQLAEARQSWLLGDNARSIEEHALLTDQRTAALVDDQARITWFCAPRLDSSSIFAELLGGPTAGHFTIRPADGSAPEAREYDGHSFHLTHRFPTFQVTDFLDCSGGRPLQRAGRTDLIRSLSGSGEVVIEFAPRLDFGRVPTRLAVTDHGLEVLDSFDPLVLRAPGLEWTLTEEGPHQTATATVELTDSPLVLELRCGTGDSTLGLQPDVRSEQTRAHWETWAECLELPEKYREVSLRSALVLKGLCYGPTGAIAAAATTSLPEGLGGVRNWDYRYCWIRDAAMTAETLVELGSLTEGMQYCDWVFDVLDRCSSPQELRPVYTLTGAELGTEAEIPELAGYAGSRPVRVGNAASRQVQLDVFGPFVQLLDVLLERGAPLSSEHWRMVQSVVTAVEARWHEPDHGIWEVRGPRRHFVHSKTMCWQAVDRGLRVARRLVGTDPPEWIALRDRIARDVCEHGWKDDVGSFVAAYDGTDLDASTLFVGLSGLLPADDPRFRATVETVERYLREGPTVYRYRFEDGLPGREGGFHICTTWLVESLILIGETDRAEKLFDDLVGLASSTLLFPEQFDPEDQRSLGNHPQAYTHLGILRCARRLELKRPAAVTAEKTSSSTNI